MKIAIVSPLQEIVPPDKYGGTELVVYNLVEGLVRRGHKVTLFARRESKTSAELVSLGLGKSEVELIEDRYISSYLLACEATRRSGEFDIVNNHAGWRFLIFAPKMKTPVLNTNHTLFYEKFHPLLKLYKEYPYTSISLDQQKKAPKELKFIANIYNGIDPKIFPFSDKKGEYLFWMGRLIEKKGAHIAIEVAKATKKKLIIAGPIVQDRPEDIEYYETKIKPHIDGNQISYFGPADHSQKVKLYKNCLLFINPVLWDEPFGLVVPEANVCGAPVISFERGAMPEIMKQGVNGYLIEPDNIQEMIKCVKMVDKMPEREYRIFRQSARKFFESYFTIDKMVDGYEMAYKKVIKKEY